MRTSILATLAVVVVVVVSASAFAQEKVATPSEHATAFPAKPLTVSGKVSADGKTFLTDIDSEWQVSNVEALKGHEGRMVRVKCYVDTEKNSIKVLSVKRDDNESNYATRNTDSAFRR